MTRGEAESRLPADAEVIVIGSGAGGSLTAATLAAEGRDVLLLEEGDDIDTAQLDTNSIEAITRLYRNGGLTPILGNQSVAYVEGRCVGGSTEINSGFWHRLPPDCYHRWRTDALLEAFSPELMEGYFRRLEVELSVSQLGSEHEPRSSALFRRGIERMGWEYLEVPRCQKDPSASAFRGGAKQSMRQTFIPRALARGTRLVAGCRVQRIEHDEGRASAVRVAVRAAGRVTQHRVAAGSIFVCGGAVQSAALLRRSGITRNVGNNLCIHPMIKAAALFDEDIDAHRGPLPMYQVKEFWPTITIGGAVFTPGFLAMILADNWATNRDVMEQWHAMSLYYAGTRGMGRGRIRALPRLDDGVVIRYNLTRADQRNLSIGLARMGELLFAAGAKAVYPSVRGLPVLRSLEECRSLLTNHLPVSGMSLSTVHAFSSCPMGENPDHCATDSFGRVNGFRNLFVNDASLIPDSPGVNPQGTTMAIALRNLDHFLEEAQRRRVHRKPEVQTAEVLVTGAPGWLGSRLVEVLGKPDNLARIGASPSWADKHVRCLVQPTADVSGLGEAGDAELLAGDLRDSESLAAFCSNAEGATLIHVAGLVHPRRWTSEFTAVNVEGARRLIEAAERAGVKRLVAVSSNSPAGCNPYPEHVFDEQSPYNPYMGYGRSKRAMEELVHAAQVRGQLETVIIRPPWFYGPHQPARQTLFFEMIRDGRFPVLGDGEQRRSMAYVDNICQGLLLAAGTPEANGNTYWIADERPYPINEIISTVEEVLEAEFGIRCTHKRMKLPFVVGEVAWLCDYGLQSLGVYNQKIHVLSEMNKTIACSIEKARRELGYNPRFALREGMVESIRWCLANGHRF